ncbi:hypothetical protein K3495_g16116, partial [Podosphaera aphanis]
MEENPRQKDDVTPNPKTPNSDSQPAVKTQNSEISTNPNSAPTPQQSFNMLSLSDVQRLIDSNNERQRNIWQSNSPGNLVLDNLPLEIKRNLNGEIPTDPWPPSTPLEPSDNYTRQLVDISKLYSNHENKWSGKLFDTLGQKLRIFHDNARKVGLPESQFQNAISSMLKDKTWDYFFDKISAKGYKFDQIIWLLRRQFETESNKQEYLNIWMRTNMGNIKAENPKWKTSQCFEHLVITLRKVLNGLSDSHQAEPDQTMRDKVYNACLGVPECKQALFKPPLSAEALEADIRTAIYNEEK